MDNTTKDKIKTLLEDKVDLSRRIDDFKPTDEEKKNNAEITTPYKLRQEMLDTVPVDFWTTPKKVLEPCSGKGGFLIDIIERFMVGLTDIKDEKERYKFIVEECIYFSEYNPLNIEINRLLLDFNDEYKLNYNEGDTLKLNIAEKWGLEGFDLVVGNPPYQRDSNNKGRGHTLWDKFAIKSIDCFINHGGFLVLVHPCGWRQYDHPCGKKILSRQLLTLNMNSTKAGLSTFGCATTYDYYLLENTSPYTTTVINDTLGMTHTINLSNLCFIPNHSATKVYECMSVVDSDTCGFFNAKSAYRADKKHISTAQTPEYKYPCIYSIKKNNELSLKWSSLNNKGHFGVSKFVVSNGAGYYKDVRGEYALTEWAYGLPCKDTDMDDVEKCFTSKEFNTIVDAIKLTSNRYNYVVMKYFKKDFWKDFV